MAQITSFSGRHDFLSNFYPYPVEFQGITYPSVEHAFQAAKSTDETERQLIARLRTPGQAKRAGRRVRLRADWESVKIDIMRDLLHEKFKSPHLKQLLLATAPAMLIEGNTWDDQFWGATYHSFHGWMGENHLGKLLMEIRDAG